MRSQKILLFSAFLVFLAVFTGGQGICMAQDEQSSGDAFHTSGLPLPRFVSLEKGKTYVRSGPGDKYPIKWVLQKQGLPVEIILEFENWRKIRDFEGQEGWVFHSMLSGQRTALVTTKANTPIYAYPFDEGDQKSRITAYFEPLVVTQVKECSGMWCNVNAMGFSGWIERKSLWGVYENENFD